ncbi:MAG: NAD-dependent epimerase/dehydratase family protein [DPANN group archaeon]|nr:NAD-dependent epimerase/dehydratase family protein [DPANN group archaeon]
MADVVNDRFWEGRKVFITGASGIVGSWLTKALIQKKADISILLRDQVGHSELFLSGDVSKVNIVRGSLESYDDIERTLNEYEIDTVFHLGAQTIVTTALRSPRSTFNANVVGTWNMLEAIRLSPLVERTIIASTDKVYGSHEKLPYTEDFALKPLHPYDASKASADLLAQTYAHSYGLPLHITRCGNIYGGGDTNFDRLIPGTIRSILRGQRPVIRSDGTFQRDYLYVEDIVDGYLRAAEHLDGKAKSDIFNFGMNRPLSVLEVVAAIQKVMGSRLQPLIQDKVKNEIHDQYLSSEKATKMLGWKPRTSISEGLTMTIPWYRKHFA